MNVANSNASCNPTDVGNVDVTEVFAAIDLLAEQMKEQVKIAAAKAESFDAVERSTREITQQIGRTAIDAFILLQGNGDLGSEITAEDGQLLERSCEPANTTVRSTFGEHRFSQFTYSPGPKKAIALRPVSARMSLPQMAWSFLLQEFSQTLAVDSSYEQAMTKLETILGGKYSVDTAERVNAALGEAANDYFYRLPEVDPQTEGTFLVASADCKGVPLIKEDAAKLAAFEATKKNPGNRRMATVASVYTVNPHYRTADDVVAALFREEPSIDSTRPKPQNKQTTAHMPMVFDEGTEDQARCSGIELAMSWMNERIETRRSEGQPLIALMDGQPSLWEGLRSQASYGRDTIEILDLLHAVSYLWQAASLFSKDDSTRRSFVRPRIHRVLCGEIRGVIRGLRRLGSTRGLKGQPAKDLARICNYLESNADRMRYDEYLRRGYPIATGVVEGACRHLVKDRMEGSGMRWTQEGAHHMLNVRAAYQSDYWQQMLQDRMQREIERVHPNRNLLGDYTPFHFAC